MCRTCKGSARHREPLHHASSWLCRRDFLVGERQDAIKKSPKRVESNKAARSVGGSHSVRAPLHTTTRADGRWPWRNTIVHSALSLGGFPLSLGSRQSSSWSPLSGDRQSAALSDWSPCGAQYFGKTAS